MRLNKSNTIVRAREFTKRTLCEVMSFASRFSKTQHYNIANGESCEIR